MMEFCPDIAMLQSAFQLINQDSCLRSHIKNTNPHAVKLTSGTITEVTRGITKCLSANDTKLKRLKLVTVLISRVLLTEREQLEKSEEQFDSWVEEWEPLIYGLPHLSWQFVFDVIKSSNMWLEIIKLLPHLPQISATQLLNELLKYLRSCPDPDDVEALDLCLSYLGLHWKSPIYNREGCKNQHDDEHSPNMSTNISTPLTEGLLFESVHAKHEIFSDEADLMTLVCTLLDIMESYEWTSSTTPGHSVAQLSLFNLIMTLYYGHGFVISQINPMEISNKEQEHCPMAVLVNLLLNSLHPDETVLHVLLSEIQNEHLPVQTMKIDEYLENNSSTIQKIWDNIFMGSFFNDASAFVHNMDKFNLDSLFHNKCHQIYQFLWTPLYQLLIMNHHEALGNRCENSTSDELTAKIQRKMQPIVEHIHNETINKKAYWEVPLNKLSKTVMMLHHGIAGALEYLKWMLEVRDVTILLEPSWIKCLESSRSLLANHDFLLCSIDQLAWIKQQQGLPALLVSKLQTLITVVFSESDSEEQNTVLVDLRQAYSNTDLEQIFNVDSSLDHQLRAALNRLTSDNLAVSMPALALVCIQSPLSTVQGIIQAAVHNRGQVNALVQILQKLPAMTQFGDGDVDSVMLTLINLTHTEGGSLSTQAEKNIATLCRQLLLPYQFDSTKPRKPPVITHAKLLKEFILPNLLPSQNASAGNDITPLCFRLFQVIIETMAELDADWTDLLMETQPIVLLSIILTRVENSMTSGDLDLQYDFSRADWLEVLGVLLATLEKYHALFSENELVWLHEHLQGYHWSTRWYCYSLFDKTLQDKYAMDVPQKMLELVSVPGLPCSVTDDGFLGLLQFVRVSDVTLTLVLSGLKDNMDLMKSNIVLALTVMLPQCTGVELCRIVRFIQHWLDHAQQDTTVPSDNSPGVRSFELLNIGVQLLVGTAGSDSSLHNWANIATAIASTVKTTILDVVAERTAVKQLCQCFIILCNMLSYWSDTGSARHLLTLGLDLIGQLDSSLQASTTKTKTATCDESDKTKFETGSRGLVVVLLSYCDHISQSEISEPLHKALCALNV